MSRSSSAEIAEHYVAASTVEETGRHLADACEVQHVDGTFNALERNERARLAQGGARAENSCRILTNARCLSEGVDVPALDAVHVPQPAQLGRRRRPVRRSRDAQAARQEVRLHHPAHRRSRPA